MFVAPEVDVTSWTRVLLEARGSGSNMWLADEAGAQWLYKATRVPEGSTEAQGEDWAEKLAERLAKIVGLPCAQVELAFRWRDGERELGVVSRDLAGKPPDLQNGALLLQDVPGYRYREEHDGRLRPPRNHRGHSVENVVAKLMELDVGPPRGWDVPQVEAVGVFAGYLVFDAWIANLDRHEENWAVLLHEDRSITLAPSYDHGAGLGAALTDDRRRALVREPDSMARHLAKAYGKKFEDGHRVPLVAFAKAALDAAGSEARRHWLDRFRSVTSADLEEAVAGIPRMSDPARTFCLQLLAHNLERVLDVCR